MTPEETAQALANWFKEEGIGLESPIFVDAIALAIKNAIRDALKCQ